MDTTSNRRDVRTPGEVAVPPVVARDDLRSVWDLLADRMRIDPHHVAFARRDGDRLVDVTTAQFHDEALGIARGLVAMGVGQGDRVVVMSPTRYEWATVSFGIWAAGAVVVPVYETASATQAAGILSATGARIAFAATPDHRSILRQANPDLGVVVFDEGSDPATSAVTDLSGLVARGTDVDDGELAHRVALVSPDDVASIVFTSGTTGAQKGVLITHGNFVGLVIQVAASYREVVHDAAVTIIVLPLAHVLAQGLQLVSIFAGMKVVHEGQPKAAVGAMAQVRPTFVVVVPRILEKILAAARTKSQDAHLGRLFQAAERTAIEWARHRERAQQHPGLRPPLGLAVRHAAFERLFYARLRALLGGRVEYLLSGASPLDPELGLFFCGIGVPVLEGYGLTETTAPVTGIRPGHLRAGSVGRPIPGSAVRIAGDGEVGEVEVRGVGVSPGYLCPADNEDAWEDGFFRTGDLGRLDQDGYLFLTGRRKDLIVTSNGKNVAPEPWERRVEASPLVSHAVMVGEGRPYAAALIVLDADEAGRWAERRGDHELAAHLQGQASAGGMAGVRVTNTPLLADVQVAVDRANAAVSRAEQVRRVTVLAAELTEDDGALTPTLKLRREAFLAAAASHIDDLYERKERS